MLTEEPAPSSDTWSAAEARNGAVFFLRRPLGALLSAAVVVWLATAAAADPVASFDAAMARAFDADPGETVAFDLDALRAAEPAVRSLRELDLLSGQASMTVIGAADLRTDRAPPDVEVVVNRPVSFRDARLRRPLRRPAPPTVFKGADYEEYPGPENGLPPPFDHAEGRDGEAAPLGLKGGPATNKGQSDFWTTGVRFARPRHDGHILFLAEYRLESGEIRQVWSEELTRAPNPPLRHPLAIVDDAPEATHLQRFAAFQVAPMEALRVDGVEGWDPRRWTPRPKLWRHDLSPRWTVVGTPETGEGWSALMRWISDLEVVGGDIVADASGPVRLGPDEPYVIALPAGVWRGGAAAKAKDVVRFDAAAETLARITRRRVMLAGVPGETRIPAVRLEGDFQIDFAFVTFGPVARTIGSGGQPETMVGDGSLDIRCHGCIFDLISGFGSAVSLGARAAPDRPAQPIFELYDSIVTGVLSPFVIRGDDRDLDGAGPRILVARSLLDCANDCPAIYGPATVLMESNYLFGNGGQRNVRGYGWLHRDHFGHLVAVPKRSDLFARGSGAIRYAAYFNIAAYGPHHAAYEALRSSPQLTQYSRAHYTALDIAWNILQQDQSGRGFLLNGVMTPGRDTAHLTPDGRPSPAFPLVSVYRATIAYNILVHWPQNRFTGRTYPELYEGRIAARPSAPIRNPKTDEVFAGRAHPLSDTLLSWGNIVRRIRSVDGQSAFDRVVNVFAEEYAARPEWPGMEDFASPPRFTQAGRWPDPTVQVVADWSATTYAGAGAEGWPDAHDFAAGPRLSSSGPDGGPGLLSAEGMQGRFLSLTTDARLHIGDTVAPGVARSGSPLPRNWFEDWAPEPFEPDAALSDPWRGEASVDDFSLMVNMRVDAPAAGVVAEERGPGGAGWRLELLADDLRPQWTRLGEGGAVTHRVASIHPVAPGDHVLVAVNTRFKHAMLEGEREIGPLVRQALHRRRYALGDASPVRLDVVPSDDAPGQAGDAIWIDTDAHNAMRVWSNGRWRPFSGAFAEFLSAWLVTRSDERTRWLKDVDLSPYRPRFTIWLAESPEQAPDAEVGDWLFALAGRGETRSDGDPGRLWRFEGRRWSPEDGERFRFRYAMRPNGWVDAHIMVGGRQSVLEPDWIWPQADTFEGRLIEHPITRGALAIGAATTSPPSGLKLNYFEARRAPGFYIAPEMVTDRRDVPAYRRADHMGIQAGQTAIQLLFRRSPADPESGARNPYFRSAPVWLVDR